MQQTELKTIRHFHSWGNIFGNTKIDRTQAPQSLGLLCLQEPWLGYTLNIPGKRKMDKKFVVLMYNGMTLSHKINVIRLVAA